MSWVGIILPLVTLVVGWLLARSREREKDRQDKTLSVYAEMLEVLALVERHDFVSLCDQVFSGGMIDDPSAKKFGDVIERFNRAHMRLLVFGSKDVIRAVSEHYRIEAGSADPEKKKSYIAILKAMRSDGYQPLFEEFAEDVDNMLIEGPANRRARLADQLAKQRGAP